MDCAGTDPKSPPISARTGLLTLAFVTVAAELGYSVVNLSALQPYIREIGLVKVIGLIYAAFLLSEAAFKSPLGALGDRVGRRRLVVGGLLLSACCEVAVAHMHRSLGIMGLRVLDGVGAAAVWPSVFALAGDCIPEGRRGGAMGLINVMYISAMGAGPALGGIVNDCTGSKRASFYLAAGVMVLAACVARALLPAWWRRPEPGAERPESMMSHLVQGMRLVPDLLPMAFVAFTGTGLLAPVVKLFSGEDLGMSETGFGVTLAVAAGVVALTAAPLGKAADRVGRVVMVRLGMGTIMVVLWAIALTQSKWTIVLFASLLGIGFMATIPAWMAIVVSRGGERRRGAAVGAVGAVQGIGMVVGTVLGGWLFASVSHRAPFFASAGALTIAFFLALGLGEDLPGRPVEAGGNEELGWSM
jgi:DHA1 family multidrug resistance protein-like MFS transporter